MYHVDREAIPESPLTSETLCYRRTVLSGGNENGCRKDEQQSGGGSKCRTLGAGSLHHGPPCNVSKDFDMSQSKTDTCSLRVFLSPLSSFCLFLLRSISRT